MVELLRDMIEIHKNVVVVVECLCDYNSYILDALMILYKRTCIEAQSQDPTFNNKQLELKRVVANLTL